MDAIARVFAVAELQEQIFFYNEKRDTARCARVCQGWLECALDQTWRDLQCIRPLLQILAPLATRADSASMVYLSEPHCNGLLLKQPVHV